MDEQIAKRVLGDVGRDVGGIVMGDFIKEKSTVERLRAHALNTLSVIPGSVEAKDKLYLINVIYTLVMEIEHIRLLSSKETSVKMDEQSARRVLGDDGIKAMKITCPHWVSLEGGEYGPDELRAIIWWVENRGEGVCECEEDYSGGNDATGGIP